MHLKIFFIFLFLSAVNIISTFSQVGINTNNPHASLDVKSLGDNPSVADGIIVPYLTKDQLIKKSDNYTNDHVGTLIYITSLGTQVPNSNDPTFYINKTGLYYFDGKFWNLLSEYTGSNGLTLNNNNFKLGGTLVEPTNISAITDENKLSFTASGIDAININGDLFSVDAANSRIGIGKNNPLYTLDVNGTLRLSQSNPLNRDRASNYNFRPIYGSTATGQIQFTPNGFPAVVGGYRPGTNTLLKKIPVNNTIVRIRFIMHIDGSSDEFNSVVESYVYGDIAIIGTGQDDPISFVQSDLKNHLGEPLSLITKSPTLLSWSIGGKQGISELSINQLTGEVSLHNYNPNTKVESPLISYFFEFFGGI